MKNIIKLFTNIKATLISLAFCSFLSTTSLSQELSLPAPSIGCKTVKPCRKRAIGRASSAATSACTTICEKSCPGLKKHLTFVSRTMSSHIWSQWSKNYKRLCITCTMGDPSCCSSSAEKAELFLWVICGFRLDKMELCVIFICS